MNRTLVNIIIDLVATLLFLGMIATGYVMVNKNRTPV